MFKKYLKKLKFNDDIDVNQMFEFGKQVGSGDDDDHFQCGFTSRQLLNRIAEFDNRGVFHIDATYKIIKHNFCLIVLGFTEM